MKSYTIPEFFELSRKKELHKIDRMLGHIRRNEKLYKQLILFLAIGGICFQATPTFAIDMTKINNLGLKGLTIVRVIGYWAILIKGLSDIVGHASQGDAKGAFSCAFRYTCIFAVLFLLPMMLDMVKEAFS